MGRAYLLRNGAVDVDSFGVRRYKHGKTYDPKPKGMGA